jgi:hypothetical protein
MGHTISLKTILHTAFIKKYDLDFKLVNTYIGVTIIFIAGSVVAFFEISKQ